MNLTGYGLAQGQACAKGIERDTDHQYSQHMEFSKIVVLESTIPLINRALARAVIAGVQIH